MCVILIGQEIASTNVTSLRVDPLEPNNVARRLESHRSYILIRALRRDIVKFETVIDRSFELPGDDTIAG